MIIGSVLWCFSKSTQDFVLFLNLIYLSVVTAPFQSASWFWKDPIET